MLYEFFGSDAKAKMHDGPAEDLLSELVDCNSCVGRNVGEQILAVLSSLDLVLSEAGEPQRSPQIQKSSLLGPPRGSLKVGKPPCVPGTGALLC